MSKINTDLLSILAVACDRVSKEAHCLVSIKCQYTNEGPCVDLIGDGALETVRALGGVADGRWYGDSPQGNIRATAHGVRFETIVHTHEATEEERAILSAPR